MSTQFSSDRAPRWVWVVAGLYSILVLGVGVWLSLALGEWIPVVLAFGLVAPVDVMVVRRWTAARDAGAVS